MSDRYYCAAVDREVDMAYCRKASALATFGSPCNECNTLRKWERALEDEEAKAPMEEDAAKGEAVDQEQTDTPAKASGKDRVGTCVECGEEKWILGKGLCNACHREKYPRKPRAPKCKKQETPTEPEHCGQERCEIPDARAGLESFDTAQLLNELRSRMPDANIVVELPACPW